ncbi:acyl-CoA carboxylase epsilon subunit [Streptomyces hyaluromycini]|uniref:acyl-CoA carboxylase epsilon subunit n=1 Tax=Streptomyces hyaluromycini TaxID=1377993 RepID=UPI000B5C369E|nr:acyl-CoA carboxylase epsilon subunit [Streptomyces hyaluromycini]
MSSRNVAPVLIRVERGRATEEELAALTLVLLAACERGADPHGELPSVRPCWWQHSTNYRSPAGWL